MFVRTLCLQLLLGWEGQPTLAGRSQTGCSKYLCEVEKEGITIHRRFPCVFQPSLATYKRKCATFCDQQVQCLLVQPSKDLASCNPIRFPLCGRHESSSLGTCHVLQVLCCPACMQDITTKHKIFMCLSDSLVYTFCQCLCLF